MTKTIADSAVAIVPSWTQSQIQLIKDTVAKGVTNDEFALFLYTATKYNLDPLIKQIWCVKYGTAPAAIFTGRDGFLAKAHESGKFDGLKTTPQFGQDGKVVSATCAVYRKDMKHPIEVTVYLQEYNSGKANWAKMPTTMICKVAESQALRKAFSISGIYSEEEGFAIENSPQPVAIKAKKIKKPESTDLLSKAKINVDEYTDREELKKNSKAYILEQETAGMHKRDLKTLQNYVNARFVELGKKKLTKKVNLP